ncbi:hypothetical protein J6497_30890 [Bradyrhizobium sp. CNPSo 4026]|nr:hypothetical protein [Bradyrhizobium cenepequi]
MTYRWKAKRRRMEVSHAKRLMRLEDENMRLRLLLDATAAITGTGCSTAISRPSFFALCQTCRRCIGSCPASTSQAMAG